VSTPAVCLSFYYCTEGPRRPDRPCAHSRRIFETRMGCSRKRQKTLVYPRPVSASLRFDKNSKHVVRSGRAMRWNSWTVRTSRYGRWQRRWCELTILRPLASARRTSSVRFRESGSPGRQRWGSVSVGERPVWPGSYWDCQWYDACV
jgi:hypothetical protein